MGSKKSAGDGFFKACRPWEWGVVEVLRWGWGKGSSLVFNLSVMGNQGSREEMWSNLSFKKITLTAMLRTDYATGRSDEARKRGSRRPVMGVGPWKEVVRV